MASLLMRTRRFIGATLAPAAARTENADLEKVNVALLSLLLCALIAALQVGWLGDAIGPVLLWCVSCLSVGATVGFLFGIPRAAAPGKIAEGGGDLRAQAGRPNTNLEEVSDWLTKIIVGLTLVNLGEIEARLRAIGHHAAAVFQPDPTASQESTATALVIGFTIIGFLGGYLYTRLFLQGAFSRSDGELRRFAEVLEEELADAGGDAMPATGEPSVPSPADRQSAERLLKAAPPNRPEAVLSPMRALATEYEQLREQLPYGAERTRRMAEIASRMKRLALAARPALAELSRSASPGERLAAVVVLQMEFEPSYIDWLAARLPEEAAFIGYQAASALLARARVASRQEQRRIGAAVRAAIARTMRPEASRDQLVAEILKEVDDVCGPADKA